MHENVYIYVRHICTCNIDIVNDVLMLLKSHVCIANRMCVRCCSGGKTHDFSFPLKDVIYEYMKSYVTFLHFFKLENLLKLGKILKHVG